MEQKQGQKKEVIRHYEGRFQDSGYHIDKLVSTEVYEYDSNGYISLYKFENYNDNGEVLCGKVAIRRYEKGTYILETYDLEGECLGYDKYDAKWQHVESCFNQQQSWTYDSDGNLIEEFCEFSNGWWKIKYEYNNEGRVIKSTRINQDSDVLVLNHHYSRDCMGNKVESIVTEDGEFLESNVIDRISNKLILNKDKGIEDHWRSILRCFKNGVQVSCLSWHSDDIVKSHDIKYSDSCLDVCVDQFLHDDESDQFAIGQKCLITIRDVEYRGFDDGLLHEFGYF